MGPALRKLQINGRFEDKPALQESGLEQVLQFHEEMPFGHFPV